MGDNPIPLRIANYGLRIGKARRVALTWVMTLAVLSIPAIPAAAAPQAPRPNFYHGLQVLLGGLFLEYPRTIWEATVDGPPIAGTAVGLIAGLTEASGAVLRGFAEMAQGFDPWGTKRHAPL